MVGFETGWYEHFDRATEHFLPFPPEDHFGLGVHDQDTAILAKDDHGVGSGFQYASEKGCLVRFL
jgi:hypothetical protein